jgi:serine/threonine protein kinase
MVETNTQVAIKCIDKSAIKKSVGTAERLLREILLHAHLRHPNITKMLEIVDTDQHIYLILEYESGGELFDYIVSHDSAIPEDVARKFFRQLVSAIQYCHAHGVAHRDLKPENCMYPMNDATINSNDCYIN